MFKVGDEVYVGAYSEKVTLESMSRRDIDDLDIGTIKYINDKECGVLWKYSTNVSILNPPYCFFSVEEVIKRKSSLEQDFKKVEENIIKNIKDGILLIEAARKEAGSVGSELTEIYEASRLLRGMIDDIGWSSSSLSC